MSTIAKVGQKVEIQQWYQSNLSNVWFKYKLTFVLQLLVSQSSTKMYGSKLQVDFVFRCVKFIRIIFVFDFLNRLYKALLS